MATDANGLLISFDFVYPATFYRAYKRQESFAFHRVESVAKPPRYQPGSLFCQPTTIHYGSC